jgi:hypothetical protein
MRLFTIHSDIEPSFLSRFVKKMIPVLEADSPEALLPDGEFGNLINHSAHRGTSIGIFCSKELFAEHTRRWHAAWGEEFKDQDISFFSLITVGQEDLDHGKFKTKLAATITKLT